MTYSIKRYLAFSLLFSIVTLNSCGPQGTDCPYDFKYYAHILQLPVGFEPNSRIYSVGDTIKVNANLSNSIYDMSTERYSTIEGFPFRPTVVLFRFNEELEWEAGFRLNEVLIDSVYTPIYNPGGRTGDAYTSKYVYSNEEYLFDFEIVLKTPGRYLFAMVDEYDENIGSTEYLNEEADAIQWEGRCEKHLNIAYWMEDNEHLLEYKNEIRLIDTLIYYDELNSLFDDDLEEHLDPGHREVEFSGFRGFEVIE